MREIPVYCKEVAFEKFSLTLEDGKQAELLSVGRYLLHNKHMSKVESDKLTIEAGHEFDARDTVKKHKPRVYFKMTWIIENNQDIHLI